MRRPISITITALLLSSCQASMGSGSDRGNAAAPSWRADQFSLFPADRSLTHAEDGVVLQDGTLLVGDFDYGLVTLSPAGEKKPFGNFAAAGFETAPSPFRGGPNGISFESDGRHVLVADIFTGSIYRADTQSQEVTRIYDHEFGVNAAVRDGTGAIWFTQSTENPAGEGAEARMFAAADKPLPDGAVYRIALDEIGKANPVAELKVEGLEFANGLVVDEQRGEIYVNEIVGNRISGFKVDLANGSISERRVVADITTPDNIEMDADGMLWVASPLGNEILMVDPVSGAKHSVFRPTPEFSELVSVEWRRRLAAGEPALELIGPDTWGPMPGLLTGIILSPDGGPVYISGLGNALVKLDR